MEHIGEERLLEFVLDGAETSAADAEHLAQCAVCQARITTIKTLAHEFAIARASELSDAQAARLFAILPQVQGQAAAPNALVSAVDALTQWIKAMPLWDSRQQAVAVRSSSQSGYRLLFGANETEVELMVEPLNGALRLVGEVIVPEVPGQNGQALIELMAHRQAKSAMEAESDVRGRFALEPVPPGVYVMTVTPRYGQVVVIEPLELT